MIPDEALPAAYVGAVEGLRGMGVLIRPDPASSTGGVLAQFDAHDAEHDGLKLGFGWHPFPGDDFALRAEPRAFRGLGVSTCHHCCRQLMFKAGKGAGFNFAVALTPDGREVRVHHECLPRLLGDGYKEKR